MAAQATMTNWPGFHYPRLHSGDGSTDAARRPGYASAMNPLLATGHISIWLLLGGLFFPRLALALAAFVFGGYPPNPLSDLANFFLWLLVPRFLMAYYIYVDMGTANIWFWAYIVTGIMGLFGEPTMIRRRVVRRRTVVSRGDGTTTTVEEIEQ
jgi:hypothetical protein